MLLPPAARRIVTGRDALLNGGIVHIYFGIPSVDNVYATLELEVFFYLAMFALWLAGALRRPVTVFTAWVALALVHELLTTWTRFRVPWFIAHPLLLDYIPYFALGAAAWVALSAPQRRPAAIALSLFSLFTLAVGDGLHGISSGPPNALIAALFLVLLVGAASGRTTWLRRRWLAWLGAISYPLYLLHQNIGYGLMLKLQALGFPALIRVAAAIALALVLAAIVHRFVEQPFIDANRRRLAARRAAAPRVFLPDSGFVPSRQRWIVIVSALALALVVGNRLSAI